MAKKKCPVGHKFDFDAPWQRRNYTPIIITEVLPYERKVLVKDNITGKITQRWYLCSSLIDLGPAEPLNREDFL